MDALEDRGDESLFRALARALMPYILEELHSADLISPRVVEAPADYDSSTCTRFVRELGDDVVDRARALFSHLDGPGGEATSVDLAEDLGATPRELSSLVTNSLKRRAARLGLPLPYDVDETADGERTVWRDRGGIAARMLISLEAEQRRRPQEIRMGRKYEELEKALALRTDDAEVTLTFAEIEEVIGETLPRSARHRRQWWSNQHGTSGHVQAEAWMRPGFRAYPNMASEQVTFRAS